MQARPLLPAALASVPYGPVLVRVRVPPLTVFSTLLIAADVVPSASLPGNSPRAEPPRAAAFATLLVAADLAPALHGLVLHCAFPTPLRAANFAPGAALPDH